MDIALKSGKVKKLEFCDYLLDAVGLSSDARQKCSELGESMEEYRSHLLECTNSNCKKKAEERIPELDKVISEMSAIDVGLFIGELLPSILLMFL